MSIKLSTEQFNLTLGELSPRTYGRTDVYWSGAKELTNVIVFPQGGFTKRPGSKYIATAHDTNYPAVLYPFIYSEEQAYILEFGNQYMRVYKDGGIVLQDGLPYRIDTDFVNLQATEMDMVSTADIAYITHKDAGIFKLTRYDHDDWELEDISEKLENGPFNTLNTDEDITITASATTGNDITLTASEDLFESGHVGGLFRIDGITVISGTITAGNQWTASLHVEDKNISVFATASVLSHTNNGWGTTTSGLSKITVQRTYDGGVTYQDAAWFKEDGTTEIAEVYGKADYIIGCKTDAFEGDPIFVSLTLMGQYGTVKIKSVTSAKVAVGNVKRTLPTLGPTSQWAEGAFSPKNGYPRAVAFFEQRLLFAGTKAKPQGVWGSRIKAYEDFDTGVGNDNHAYAFDLESQDINTIQYLIPADILRVFSAGKEWRFGFIDQATVPKNVNAKIQTNAGCNRVKPVYLDGTVMFIQNIGRKLLAQTYDFRSETYQTPEISNRSEHLFKVPGGITNMCFQQEPDSLLWLVRFYDGVLLSMTYKRDQNINAFTKHITDGLFEYVASIPGDDRNEMWVSVYREIDGQGTRYIEQLQTSEWSTIREAVYVDSAIEYTSPSGTGVATLGDAGHLEGKEVCIVADGVVLPRQTVVDGVISLDRTVEHAWVGLPYTAIYESMDLDYNIQGTSTVGKPKRVHDFKVKTLNTNYLRYGPDGKEDYFKFKQNNYSEMIPFVNGTLEGIYPVGFKNTQTIRLVSDEPLPMTVISIAPVITTSV